MVTIEEVKVYLKVEHDEEDFFIEQLMATSQQLCEDILRQSTYSDVLKTAILYGVAYLYEHREDANHKELKDVYLTQQNEALKEKEIVQKALYQLAETYGIITETVEEQKRLTEIEYLLLDYPGSLDFWKKAMSHYQAFQYRESLDNARLCLELLLKSLLANEKSLENQRKSLGGWLKEQGVPKEISNMIWERLDYYAASQNNHVKHKKIKELTKKLTEIEVCLILDETYAIIKYLVNRTKEASHV